MEKTEAKELEYESKHPLVAYLLVVGIPSGIVFFWLGLPEALLAFILITIWVKGEKNAIETRNLLRRLNNK